MFGSHSPKSILFPIYKWAKQYLTITDKTDRAKQVNILQHWNISVEINLAAEELKQMDVCRSVSSIPLSSSPYLSVGKRTQMFIQCLLHHESLHSFISAQVLQIKQQNTLLVSPHPPNIDGFERLWSQSYGCTGNGLNKCCITSLQFSLFLCKYQSTHLLILFCDFKFSSRLWIFCKKM